MTVAIFTAGIIFANELGGELPVNKFCGKGLVNFFKL